MAQDPKESGTINEAAAGGNAEIGPEPASLRFLRVLVTVLTGVMIVGMVTLVILFFTRFPGGSDTPALPQLPDRIALPGDAQPQAVTTGPGWLAVVTQDGRILFFDAETGALLQEVLRADD